MSFHVVLRDTFSIQAAVGKNHKGEIKKILTQVKPPCSQVNGEAQAAKLVGVLASSMQLEKFILEGESSSIILALQNSAVRLDFLFEHIVNDTPTSFPASSLWEAKKISRNENFCAFYVIYRATTRVFPSCILSLSFPPSSIPLRGGKDPPPFNPP